MDNMKRFTQAYTQAPWRRQLQVVAFFMLVLVFVAIIAGIYLNVTAQAVTLGQEIQDMQDQMRQVKQENEGLLSVLANLRSSSVMEERAKAMGFEPVQTDQLNYVEIPGYVPRQSVALASPPVSTVVTTQVISPEFSESLWDWFRQNVIDPTILLAEGKP